MDKETQEILKELKNILDKRSTKSISEYLSIILSMLTLLSVIVIGVRKVDKIDTIDTKLDRTTFSIYGDYVNDRFETVNDNFVELKPNIKEIKPINMNRIMNPTRGGVE